MIVWAETEPDAASEPTHPALARIPAFPSTAGRVINLLSRRVPEIPNLVQLVQSDPTFVAELLRLANSAAYSTRGQVSSLNQAIAIIGFDRLRSFTLAIALRSVLKRALHFPAARRCWVHSLATAKIAERIADIFKVSATDAYTLGLLHDVGRIGLVSADTSKYCRLLDTKHSDAFALAKVERSLLGLDHTEAGEILARYWGLPEIVSEVAGFHHEDVRADAGAELVVTHLACRLADSIGFNASNTDTVPAAEIVAPWNDGAGPAILSVLEDLKAELKYQLEELGLF